MEDRYEEWAGQAADAAHAAREEAFDRADMGDEGIDDGRQDGGDDEDEE